MQYPSAPCLQGTSSTCIIRSSKPWITCTVHVDEHNITIIYTLNISYMYSEMVAEILSYYTLHLILFSLSPCMAASANKLYSFSIAVTTWCWTSFPGYPAVWNDVWKSFFFLDTLLFIKFHTICISLDSVSICQVKVTVSFHKAYMSPFFGNQAITGLR